MTRTELIELMNNHVKLIRNEYDLTQEKMASLLGISKKTLVEIEKRRSSLGWTGTVALASLFSNSSVLINALGTDVDALISAVAFDQTPSSFPKTMGGKVWWKLIREDRGYRIQQNLISHHYRLLDLENRRRYASFDLEEIEKALTSLVSHEV
jgi:DNA-binding XRE family transcriptional regulator